MQCPLVSAIILCYNHAQFVTECLEGVKSQNYPNLELVVCDDASQDASAGVIQAWLARSGIPHRFLRHETNQGLCRSLNHAISVSRGNYISGIGADDAWLPGKLLTQVEMIERLPQKVGLVYSNALQVDEAGNVLSQRFIEAHGHVEPMPQGNIQQALWEGNFIPAMTTLVRRECYDKVGRFDEDLFYEDWDMWLRIARCFEFAYSDHVSAKYRLVSTSMARSQVSRMADSTCQICVKHLKAGCLDGKTRTTAAHWLYNYAIASYEHKSPKHRRNLLQALRFKPTPGLALRCICAVCGIGPERFGRMRRILQERSFGA
jgi:glycosyltransferase involved in cell wall biosynthesis